MTPLLIPDALVRCSLSPEECLAAVEEGFRLQACGAVAQTDSRMLFQQGTASLNLYGAHVPGYGTGAKVLGAYQANPALGLPYIQALVLLVNTQTGELEAVIDGRYLTALRTAAAIALAARHLMCQDSTVLGILGTGLQARTHLLCHLVAHPFERIVLWGRTAARVQEYLDEMRTRVEIPIAALDSPAAVCSQAHVISCATRANAPLFDAQVVCPGTHIGVAGPLRTGHTEIPLDLVHAGLLFVDSAEKFEQLWEPETAPRVQAELGDVLNGSDIGRPDANAITVFKPVGMAFEDVVSARIIVDHVLQAGLGFLVSW